MGYRSQVILALKADQIKPFLKKVVFKSETKNLFEDCEIHTTFDDMNDDNGILFYWEHIKWYPSYDDIQLVDNFMTKLHDTEEGESSYHFVRVGEDRNDIECHGGWWTNPFDISVKTSCEFFGSGKQIDRQELKDLDNRREPPKDNRYKEILKEIE
jgi:hypothetical protein